MKPSASQPDRAVQSPPRHRPGALLLLVALALFPARADEAGDPSICGLLASEEILAIQREPVRESTATRRVVGGTDVGQCYYALPSHTRSVSLQVVRPAPGGAGPGPRAQWEELFAAGGGSEQADRPHPVNGVGEQAFWSGNALVGALYVLQGDSYLRVSIGGPGDEADRIRRCRELAFFALGRL